MKIQNIWAVYFSPVGNTKKITVSVATFTAEKLGINRVNHLDITKPKFRMRKVTFKQGDLVFIGVPTYAGRVPNKIMPFIKEALKSTGALGVALVTYGGRSFDDSLIELSQLMKENGFIVIGGGAFVCQHAFAHNLAKERPNKADIAKALLLGRFIARKIGTATTLHELRIPNFPGNQPLGSYYVPKGTDGLPVNFLKARPVTDHSKCTSCGICAKRCPMDSIDPQKYFEVTGVCIKCQACITYCPTGAKFMDDSSFLSHRDMLETSFNSADQESKIYY